MRRARHSPSATEVSPRCPPHRAGHPPPGRTIALETRMPQLLPSCVARRSAVSATRVPPLERLQRDNVKALSPPIGPQLPLSRTSSARLEPCKYFTLCLKSEPCLPNCRPQRTV